MQDSIYLVLPRFLVSMVQTAARLAVMCVNVMLMFQQVFFKIGEFGLRKAF